MVCDDCPNLSCEITEPSIKSCCNAQFVEKMKVIVGDKEIK